jgi:hypothetical protein
VDTAVITCQPKKTASAFFMTQSIVTSNNSQPDLVGTVIKETNIGIS